MSKFKRGTAWPLGATITKNGINFSVAAPKASYIELLIFDKNDEINPSLIITLDNKNRSGDFWHVEVEGLTIGCIYSYRVYESNQSLNNKFYPGKVLLDPCARAITGWDSFDRRHSTGEGDNINNCLKGVVSERNYFDLNSHPRPRHPWNETIIYELHVGGFTNSKDSCIEDHRRGTYLGVIDKIPYLKDLGITTIELLPVFAFDKSDAPLGLENYWGYSPLNWFTPHQHYASSKDPLAVRNEFREFIAACHDNDLEVIIDVVYNHTTEGNKDGPIISWKGFCESLYYYQDKDGNYLDVTGCGNTIAANRPLVRQLIIESIKCWANELGVDGFRFDLGIALSRGEGLTPLDSPPLFEEIESDPFLSELKLISEPWDCGGLYRLADFPATRFATWNGHFRDQTRQFWKGNKDTTWALKDRLIGSPELYKDKFNSASKSINFITSHDGFTLYDLVSFDIKHNFSNGENNRDGENNNNNWNHGLEGPSTNKDLIKVRHKQQMNLLSSLILSPGIPMILMGDEVGRSQGGNNNTWCQNNSLGWMIWNKNDCNLQLKDFCKKVIFLRKELGLFFSPENTPLSKSSYEPNNHTDLWVQWHGVKINQPDWSSWSHTISYSINKANKGAALWIGLNAYNQSIIFELPKPISKWKKLIDTSNIENSCLSSSEDLPNQKKLSIESRSLVIIAAEEFLQTIKV